MTSRIFAMLACCAVIALTAGGLAALLEHNPIDPFEYEEALREQRL